MRRNWLSVAHVGVVVGILNLAIAASAVHVLASRASVVAGRAPAAGTSVAREAAGPERPRRTPPAPVAASPKAERSPPAEASAPGLPIAGKGMWIWLFDQVAGGDPRLIAIHARRLGLTHLYVRSSSSDSGLKWLRDIDRILPDAHAAGLRVIAWDFTTLDDPEADVRRLVAVLDHVAPGGHKVDGIAVDLETPAEGVTLTPERAHRMSSRLRELRPGRFRVLVPPRPSEHTKRIYPYDIIKHYDAVAPMVYWLNREPVSDVRGAIAYLKPFGKPIAPIGQAYDGAAEGGTPGPPSGRLLKAFADEAIRGGAIGLSFWSWQHATGDQFRAIGGIRFPGGRLPAKPVRPARGPASSKNEPE